MARRQPAKRRPTRKPAAEAAAVVALRPTPKIEDVTEADAAAGLNAYLDSGGDIGEAAKAARLPLDKVRTLAATRQWPVLLDNFRRRMTENIIEDAVARHRRHLLRLHTINAHLYNAILLRVKPDKDGNIRLGNSTITELTRALTEAMRMERLVTGDDKQPPPPPANFLAFVRDEIETAEEEMRAEEATQEAEDAAADDEEPTTTP